MGINFRNYDQNCMVNSFYFAFSSEKHISGRAYLLKRIGKVVLKDYSHLIYPIYVQLYSRTARASGIAKGINGKGSCS